MFDDFTERIVSMHRPDCPMRTKQRSLFDLLGTFAQRYLRGAKGSDQRGNQDTSMSDAGTAPRSKAFRACHSRLGSSVSRNCTSPPASSAIGRPSR
jgi:hypothetical protein